MTAVLDPEWLLPAGAGVSWISRELDRVRSVSHEHSITFAGGWLVAGVETIWPNWRGHPTGRVRQAAAQRQRATALFVAA